MRIWLRPKYRNARRGIADYWNRMRKLKAENPEEYAAWRAQRKPRGQGVGRSGAVIYPKTTPNVGEPLYICRRCKTAKPKTEFEDTSSALCIECLEYPGMLRQHRIEQNGGSYSDDEWYELKEYYDFTCLCCGRREPEIKLSADHVLPVALGGSSYISNIQPLCVSCNSRKGTRTIDYRRGHQK